MVAEIDLFGEQTRHEPFVESGASAPSRLSVLAGAIGVAALVGAAVFVVDWGTETTDDEDALVEEEASEVPDSEPAGVQSVDVGAAEEVLVERGGRLVWDSGTELGAGWPLPIVEYQDSLYLFAQSAGPWEASGQSDLAAWRSFDGQQWESLGAVSAIRGHVRAVAASPAGLVMVGTGENQEPMAWTSTDAVSWDGAQLPGGDRTPGLVPDGVVATGDLIVISATEAWSNVYQRVNEAVAEYTGLDIDSGEVGFGWSGSTVSLFGPLGLRLLEVSAEELGLSEDDFVALNGPSGPPESAVWSSTDGGESWTVAELDGLFVQGLSVGQNGDILATGFGAGRPGLYVSTDGQVWEPQGSTFLRSARVWNERLVAVRDDETGGLVTSTDGVEWQPVPVTDLLSGGFEWHISEIAAGPSGIAVIAEGFNESFEPQSRTATLLKDGYSLTARGQSRLELKRDGITLLSTTLHTPNVSQDFVLDMEQATVTFVDNTTGEAYVTFTFGELRALEAEIFGGSDSDWHQQVLVSVDSVTWSIQARLEGSRISALHLSDDAVLAVAMLSGTESDAAGDVPTIVVRRAELPTP